MARDEEEEEQLIGENLERARRGIPAVVIDGEVPPMKFMADIFSGHGGFGQAIREELQCQT
eukprot:6706877-Pyramimonas_sp.AAC.1